MHEIAKQRPIEKYSALVVLFFVIFIIHCILPGHANALIGIKEGDLPKQVVLDDITGAKVDVTGFFGNKPVVLVFWKLTGEKYLDYSLDELIFLRDLHERYHDKAGLKIFGIYTPDEDKNIPDSEINAVQNLIKINRITFPILIDRGFKMFKEYGVIALPSTIMIDKTGKIKFIYPGFPISAQSIFTEQIMDLIGAAKISHEEEGIKTKRPDAGLNRLSLHLKNLWRWNLIIPGPTTLWGSYSLKEVILATPPRSSNM